MHLFDAHCFQRLAFRKTLILLKAQPAKPRRIISATKGLEANTGQLLHTIIKQELGETTPFAIISGPSFAKEVAVQQATSVMIASPYPLLLPPIRERFETSHFRVFPTDDVIGVEIGAIVKNIVAIAVGIADGLSLGANAKSAIITLGLHEMIMLGKAMGARVETLVGLAGAGDLILTCTDNQSRNRRFGIMLGQGKSVLEAEQEIGHVVEGKSNLELALMLSKKQGVTLIIAQAISTLLAGKCTAKNAITQILKTGGST